MRSVLSIPRPEYIAAHNPAGPPPITMTSYSAFASRVSVTSPSSVLSGLSVRYPKRRGSDPGSSGGEGAPHPIGSRDRTRWPPSTTSVVPVA